MRVAAYVRVSTDRQQLAQTIQQQVELLLAYVRRQPEWALDEAHIFRDDGYSGARLQRPGLDALRDQVARAAFDVVVITAPDRLARHFVHQMVVLDEWERAGIEVVFIDRPPSRDPHEQLVTQIRGAVAEYERTLIADRMRRGRLAKLRAGQLLPWTSHVPYGYRVDPERPRDSALVTLDPYAASIVREVFATYADGSATLHGLAEALTRRGVPTPTGLRLWSPATLHGILTNPAYIGQAVAQRYQTRTPQQRHSPLLPIGRTRERHSSPSRPREEWIIVPIPALVPEAHFVAAQQRLVHNRVVARRNLKHKYLLQGLVSCGHCRLCCFVRARGRTVAPGESEYHYYLCRGKQAAVTSRHEQLCPSRFIPAAELDALVWADLCAVLQTPEILAEALQRARTGAWLPETVQQQHATIQTARKSLERQQERLLDAYVAGLLELAAFEKRQRGFADRLVELAARERELLAQGQRLLDTAKILASMTEVCARLRQNLEVATFEQRRELVELLIDRVVVTDDDVEIRYAVPTTEGSLHTRFCQLRQDYLHHPPSESVWLWAGRALVADQGDVRVVVVVDAGTPSVIVVVSLVQAQVLRPALLDRRSLQHDGLDGRRKELGVRDVGPGHDDRQRAAVGLDQEGALHARLGAVGRVGADEVPPHPGLAHRRVGRLPLPVAPAQVLAGFLDQRPDPVEDLKLHPALERAVDRAIVRVFLGQAVPLAPAPHPEDHRVQRAALVDSPRPTLRRVILSQDRLDHRPQLVRRLPDRRQRLTDLLRPAHRGTSRPGSRMPHAGLR
jgi:site-specific DNA recombinase